jgi:methionine synthase II (cobalamin-independent)
MNIPTEPIGSIPRPLELLEAMTLYRKMTLYSNSHPCLESLYDKAVRDTIEQFEATGSPVVTAGEQRKYPRIEHPKEIRDRILEAARYIPVEQLGTTDDCGFSPFCDDTSTTREKAFAKIRLRVEGTALAEDVFNGS